MRTATSHQRSKIVGRPHWMEERGPAFCCASEMKNLNDIYATVSLILTSYGSVGAGGSNLTRLEGSRG